DFQQQADQQQANGASLGRVGGRQNIGENLCPGPQQPDAETADQCTQRVAAAAGHEHDPDQECAEQGQESLGGNKADEVCVQRAGKAHQGGADDKCFQPETVGILAGSNRAILVFAL